MLEDVILLGVESNRTKAYLQILAKNDLLPSHVILMLPDPSANMKKSNTGAVAGREDTKYFVSNESVIYTLEERNIRYSIIKTSDVNSDEVTQMLKSLPQKYVIYSGFGGQILGSHLFALDKRYIHVHPGIVPEFRGSTTIYYSLLSNGTIGATAMFLDEQIDTGPIIKKKNYFLPEDPPNLDYIYDPYIRAELLAEVMKEYRETGFFTEGEQDPLEGETYHIIHPVLKHIALLSFGGDGR